MGGAWAVLVEGRCMQGEVDEGAAEGLRAEGGVRGEGGGELEWVVW